VFLIASTDAEAGLGRTVNKNGEFSHQTVAHLLGGQYTELTIVGDGQAHPATGDVYFALEETVNGAKKREEFKIKAEQAEAQEEQEGPRHEDEEEVGQSPVNDAAAEAQARAEALADMESEA